MPRACLVLLPISIGIALAACGGSAPAPQAPEAPPDPNAPAAAPEAPGSQGAEGEYVQPGTVPAPTGTSDAQPSWQAAWNDLEQSSAELKALEAQSFTAGQACDRACSALRSMERAVSHLCDLAQDNPERERCDVARERYQDARGRVRVACRQCSGGPSLDE